VAMISRLFDFLPSGSGIPVALRIAVAGVLVLGQSASGVQAQADGEQQLGCCRTVREQGEQLTLESQPCNG
jgi:hypothetical protein